MLYKSPFLGEEHPEDTYQILKLLCEDSVVAWRLRNTNFTLWSISTSAEFNNT